MDTIRDPRPVPPRSEVSAAAYRRLRDLVGDGRLAAGAPLIEADLSKRLGVSRTPIRAALLRLRQEGFVTPSPVGEASRPVVAPLTARDLRELFLMAGALEAAAVRIAAGADAASRAALARDLEKAVDGLQAAGGASPPDLPRMIAQHVRFHRRLVDAGAGPRLKAEYDVLRPQVERYLRAYAAALLVSLQDTVAGYRAVVAALAAADPDGAERDVAASWRKSADRVGLVVAAVGEQGTW